MTTKKKTAVETTRVSTRGTEGTGKPLDPIELQRAIRTPGEREAAGSNGRERVRMPVRLHPDSKARAEYWAKKHNLSANDYAAEAIEAAIRRENQDYDLPTLEQQRLNQLIDEVKSLSSNQRNLESIIVSGFDSLLGMTRGDNYLLNEEEDGELTNG